ncbi:MAG: citramalate synthase [Geminocystis sp.]|nr:citramalate synthase [Geminocystis sp.]HIK38622.1 citramalate synthase [Geminocystis sp. M7585_C2015_104]MCS7147686.1 citramalate synthase [Geminocystis sp.]MCX8078471.1 citramalate synthase [Geminocystis sp.]MDW8117241.1 citramalate synthase [Geminocystis sp.]
MREKRIWVYDTTLRDGAQREGIALSLTDKLKIVRKLDEMGIPFIEGGWPGANPKDVELFRQLRVTPPKKAEVVAFCATRRPGNKCEQDSLLQAILEAETRWVTVFGKSWDLHVTQGLQTSLEENLAMIQETIAFFRQRGRQVIYDAEHWFDGYKANPDYALATLRAAIAGGAQWLVFCDTNGGCLPHEVSSIISEVVAKLSSDLTHNIGLGIHTHNDSGTAVANALAAVLAGVTMVQGTINGYGERCGNADLCTLIPNLQLKLGYKCLEDEQLQKLTATSRYVSEIANLAPDDHAPFVGKSAFAHKGGVHVSAVLRNPVTYEHIEPERVGNARRIVISEQAGQSNVISKVRELGLNLDKQDPRLREILQKLKDLEYEGYQFEGAEASFDLLILSCVGLRKKFFTIKGFQVHCDLLAPEDNSSFSHSLATVKVLVDGQELLEVAEGNGPVSALDHALRKALMQFYPEIGQFHLTDYKVRILDGSAGTSAKTRVLVEFSNGEQSWTTVGVSTNIITASYQAVVEGIEYGLLLSHGTINNPGKQLAL